MFILSFLDRESAETLSSQVTEALLLLNDYNSRLASEVEIRKKLQTMLKEFIYVQRELLAQAEKGLEVSIPVFIIFVLN